jgi:hypothetical protein
MTQLNPTIIVQDLRVIKDGREVFGCKFHTGVNIISGHNSSGKTTVLDFLAYALGAEFIPWKQEALLCDEVIVSVELNAIPVTLRRAVNRKAMNPMQIFWGDMESAIVAPYLSWETYPFKRSSTKISFTQALLLAMGLPEAQGDGASNLTMHQFLRVIYADQPSLHSPIFRTDTFDSPLIRETVGNYLCGIYDDKLYTSQLERRALIKSEENVSAELRSIFSVLARSEQDFSLEFFSDKLRFLSDKKQDLMRQLSLAKTNRVANVAGDTELINSIREQLNIAKRNLVEEEDRLQRIELEQLDSNQFINELRYRLKSLGNSETVRTYLGSLKFSFCPACFSEVAQRSELECGLCKSPIISDINDSQILRMKNELRIQLNESENLLEERQNEISKIVSNLPLLRYKLDSLEDRYSELSKHWMTQEESASEALAMSVGAVDQEIKNVVESQRLALVIKELQEKRLFLTSKLAELDSTIERLDLAQADRQRVVAFEIASRLGELLRRDLYRQEEFKKANHITFSFSENLITVDGASKFSESSTVVLRHLFHVAMLSASMRLPNMRLPRFMMLDGIEDGGMELERAHLLQELIVEECTKFQHDYQLIIASSQISPALNKHDYIVGRTFTEANRSLAIR